MKYVRLGNSGLKVSKLILGCMSFGNRIWQDWVLEEKEAIEHIKLAYDSGINTFDTADMYSCGDSEIILGKALKQLKIPREDVVILTKVFFPDFFGQEDALRRQSGRTWIRQPARTLPKAHFRFR